MHACIYTYMHACMHICVLLIANTRIHFCKYGKNNDTIINEKYLVFIDALAVTLTSFIII